MHIYLGNMSLRNAGNRKFNCGSYLTSSVTFTKGGKIHPEDRKFSLKTSTPIEEKLSFRISGLFFPQDIIFFQGTWKNCLLSKQTPAPDSRHLWRTHQHFRGARRSPFPRFESGCADTAQQTATKHEVINTRR